LLLWHRLARDDGGLVRRLDPRRFFLGQHGAAVPRGDIRHGHQHTDARARATAGDRHTGDGSRPEARRHPVTLRPHDVAAARGAIRLLSVRPQSSSEFFLEIPSTKIR